MKAIAPVTSPGIASHTWAPWWHNPAGVVADISRVGYCPLPVPPRFQKNQKIRLCVWLLNVSNVPVTLQATPTDFIITGSVDGHLKFWKKQEQGIEFVKHYRAHLGSVDGELALTRLEFVLCMQLDRVKEVEQTTWLQSSHFGGTHTALPNTT